jgi:hypothetical protein
VTSPTYLLAGQASELERLKLQSQVWEPVGGRLLEQIDGGTGCRALDIGRRHGMVAAAERLDRPGGEVVGTDSSASMCVSVGILLPRVVRRTCWHCLASRNGLTGHVRRGGDEFSGVAEEEWGTR